MADTSKTSYLAAFFNGDSEKLNVKFKNGLEQDFQSRREIHFKNFTKQMNFRISKQTFPE